MRQVVIARVRLCALLLPGSLLTVACLPADVQGEGPAPKASHEHYPEFEGLGDTANAVLTGSGGQADWSDEANSDQTTTQTQDRTMQGSAGLTTVDANSGVTQSASTQSSPSDSSSSLSVSQTSSTGSTRTPSPSGSTTSTAQGSSAGTSS